jgi:hypothetical protein
LGIDLDKPEQSNRWRDILMELVAAGAIPIFWQRKRGRGHLELYFNERVCPDAARAWCISVSPILCELAGSIEWFPGPARYKNPLSWPLYQRVGSVVSACTGYVVLPDGPGELIEVSAADREGLAAVVIQALTPTDPIREVEARMMAERLSQTPVLLARPSYGPQTVYRRVQANEHEEMPSRRDLAKQVIADFNASHRWLEIAGACGGMSNGRFRAIWRGESSASVVPDRAQGDRESNYACDYGAHGDWPRKFDKYDAWCMANHVNKRVDLADRIAKLRARLESGEVR